MAPEPVEPSLGYSPTLGSSCADCAGPIHTVALLVAVWGAAQGCFSRAGIANGAAKAPDQ